MASLLLIFPLTAAASLRSSPFILSLILYWGLFSILLQTQKKGGGDESPDAARLHQIQPLSHQKLICLNLSLCCAATIWLQRGAHLLCNPCCLRSICLLVRPDISACGRRRRGSPAWRPSLPRLGEGRFRTDVTKQAGPHSLAPAKHHPSSWELSARHSPKRLTAAP